MSKDRKPSSPSQLEGTLDEDLLFGPLELAQDELRLFGMDPSTIKAWGDQLVQDLREEQRLSWKTRAQSRLSRARDTSASLRELPTDKGSLLALLEQARSNPRFSNQVEMAFRDRSAEEANEEELAGLLEDIRFLDQLEDDEP
ncbi:MAG: hypothetical protein ACE37F_25185 [Nannocystaceae bacterium]|nr:hypothetical protein [bacterium]